jgi:hypothetical protein
MKIKIQYFPILVLGSVAIGILTSCNTLRNKQLESTAKDWALTVRASQVIPVYPLTEDLQPGDVLLVTTPIGDQIKVYTERGYLPLDQHLIRLYPDGYPGFYSDGRYGVDPSDKPPKPWWSTVKEGDKTVDKWDLAPHVSFPSYQFSVNTSLGLSAAIPIQGIPVAMGLMNTSSASGAVSFTDAYSYGLDIYHMWQCIRDWAAGLEARQMLRTYAPQKPGSYQFLRVITRVYVVRGIDVTVNNDASMGANAGLADHSPISTLGSTTQGSSAESYKNMLDAINTMVSNSASLTPGAQLKFVSATSRTTALKETFSRPLVIGYIGFDLPILDGGYLGGPISTLEQLKGAAIKPQQISLPSFDLSRLSEIRGMYNNLKNLLQTDERAKTIVGELNELSSVIPPRYPFDYYFGLSPTDKKPVLRNQFGSEVKKSKDFDGVIDYLDDAAQTIDTLGAYNATMRDSTLVEDVENASASVRDVSSRVLNSKAFVHATDYMMGIAD